MEMKYSGREIGVFEMVEMGRYSIRQYRRVNAGLLYRKWGCWWELAGVVCEEMRGNGL